MNNSLNSPTPPTLLDLAKADPVSFRIRTAEALVGANYRSMADTLTAGRWPAGLWNSLTHWAVESKRHHETRERAVVARDHLAALAEAHGLRFHYDAARETTVMVSVEGGIEVSDDDLGFHGEHVTDPMGSNPTEYFANCARKEDAEAERGEANGETINPRIHRRRAAWYRTAANVARRW